VARNRANVMGIYCEVVTPGTVNVGDTLAADLSADAA
jgi:MOSC domain-containing protein YiiM